MREVEALSVCISSANCSIRKVSMNAKPWHGTAEPPPQRDHQFPRRWPAQGGIPRLPPPGPEHGPEIPRTARQLLPARARSQHRDRRSGCSDHDFDGVRPRDSCCPDGIYDLKQNRRIHPPRHESLIPSAIRMRLRQGLVGPIWSTRSTRRRRRCCCPLRWRRGATRRTTTATSSTCSALICTRLANDLELEIRRRHYPPYASKFNPIEHRPAPT